MEIEFHSHEQQDEFVFNLFGKDYQGYFLDIACGHPIIGSNTYTLEKFCQWNGLCFDIENLEKVFSWGSYRSAEFVQMDATSEHLTTFLKNNLDPNQIIDYISLDVDTSTQDEKGQLWSFNLSFLVLQQILKAGVRFKALTIEHEFYKYGDVISKPSRELLESLGYIRLYEDVKLLNQSTDSNNAYYFEDWWIDPRFFSLDIINAARSKLYYFDCINHLRKFSNISYTPKHMCSKAWPDEYTYFHSEQEKTQFQELTNQQK
jgi:hypothetical protein